METGISVKLTPELQKNLTDFTKANNLSMRELAQLSHMIAIRESIIEEYHKSPITQNKTNRRWYTRLPDGKQVVKTIKADLEDVLVAYYANRPEVKQQFQKMGLLPSQETVYPAKQTNACTLKTIYPNGWN